MQWADDVSHENLHKLNETGMSVQTDTWSRTSTTSHLQTVLKFLVDSGRFHPDLKKGKCRIREASGVLQVVSSAKKKTHLQNDTLRLLVLYEWPMGKGRATDVILSGLQ